MKENRLQNSSSGNADECSILPGRERLGEALFCRSRQLLDALFLREATLAGTALGQIEVAATLARRARSGTTLPALQHQLQADWNSMLQFEMTSSLYEQALLIAWEQKLRGTDAIHLAAALQLREQASRRFLEFILVASDTELIRAAQELKLTVTNPAELA